MNITVISAGKRQTLQADAGANLMECLNQAGLMEGSECGGRGVCGKCVVKVLSGGFTPLKEGADRRFCSDGEALSCNCLIREDAVVEVGYGRDDVSRKAKLPPIARRVAKVDSAPVKLFVELVPPHLRDQLPDIERLLEKLPPDTTFAPGILHDLPTVLRRAGFKVTCTLYKGELIAVEEGDTTASNYGLIVDIGTTTVAMYLVNMLTGEPIDAHGLANPQRVFGADVLSRITAASTPEGLKKLQGLILEGLSEAILAICARNGVDPGHVYRAVVVGNTTMSHLFLGVDPTNLAMAPFVPGYRQSITVRASSLGLPMRADGLVHVLPNISGYVGSDTTGVAMATKPWEQDGVSIAVDIGTNGEIILGFQDRLYTCSAAAGPAFEGAHIEMGMRAGEGAIEKVSLRDDRVTLSVIGNAAPQGICGSGLIDAVAELLLSGLLNRRGSFISDKDPAFSQPLASRLRDGANGLREFVLAYAGEYRNARDIVITQKDVRELQLAKAAIAAGIEILLKEAGCTADQVDRLFLAGAFGNYLDREKAVALGLFPGIPVEKIIPVGNAAAEGAGLCLISEAEREMSNRLDRFARPVELSTHPDFNDLWIHAISFPKPGRR